VRKWQINSLKLIDWRAECLKRDEKMVPEELRRVVSWEMLEL
jgi:hypothetical protein